MARLRISCSYWLQNRDGSFVVGGNALVIHDVERVGVGGANEKFAVLGAVPLEVLVGRVVDNLAVAVIDGELQLSDEVPLRDEEVVVDAVYVAGCDGVGQIEEGLAGRDSDGARRVGDAAFFIHHDHRVVAGLGDGDARGVFAGVPLVFGHIAFCHRRQRGGEFVAVVEVKSDGDFGLADDKGDIGKAVTAVPSFVDVGDAARAFGGPGLRVAEIFRIEDVGQFLLAGVDGVVAVGFLQR